MLLSFHRLKIKMQIPVLFTKPHRQCEARFKVMLHKAKDTHFEDQQHQDTDLFRFFILLYYYKLNLRVNLN